MNVSRPGTFNTHPPPGLKVCIVMSHVFKLDGEIQDSSTGQVSYIISAPPDYVAFNLFFFPWSRVFNMCTCTISNGCSWVCTQLTDIRWGEGGGDTRACASKAGHHLVILRSDRMAGVNFWHTLFTNSPVIPALFLALERKLEEVHERFMEYLAKLIPTLIGGKWPVPLVTDAEVGIDKVRSRSYTMITVNLEIFVCKNFRNKNFCVKKFL